MRFTKRTLKYRAGYRDPFYYPCRSVLGGINLLYTFGSGLRRHLYLNRLLKSNALKGRVISVGNIVAGGTGKTPVVIYLAQGLTKRGYKVAVLTRGYRREVREQVIFRGKDSGIDWQNVGDEPFLISKRLPELTIGVSKDRYRCGADIVNRLHPDVLILDDGFQHHKLHRDLDLVVLDSTFPFGAKFQLKRERKTALRFADLLVLNDTVGKGTIEPISEELKRLSPSAVVAVTTYRFSGIRNHRDDSPIPMEKARQTPLLAFSGIGDPFSFGTTLSQLGLKTKEHIVFADHYRFGLKDYLGLVRKAEELQAEALMTTEKDAIRLLSFDKLEMPIYYVTVEVEFLQGEDSFWKVIENRMQDADRE